MPESPSHRLGELIGDLFEKTIIDYLNPLVEGKGHYLDYKHPRPARGNRKDVIGTDAEGNEHKLDIVIEKEGSEEKFGAPKAFIEIAWRRYTKHSRAKAQEISGAILPLVKKHKQDCPFYAAVLSGEFTSNSIKQLESQGFHVTYFPYDDMCKLYEDAVGIKISWEENTPDEEIEKVAERIKALTNKQKQQLIKTFHDEHKEKLKELSDAVEEALDQIVTQIIVIPIHGEERVLSSVDDAVEYIKNYDETSKAPILRYEITIKYSSNDEFTMRCSNKQKAIRFLNQYK